MKNYILNTIRNEFPVMASVLKSDIRTMQIHGGAKDLDADKVLRTLAELEGEGLVMNTLGGWIPIGAW